MVVARALDVSEAPRALEAVGVGRELARADADDGDEAREGRGRVVEVGRGGDKDGPERAVEGGERGEVVARVLQG